MYLEQALVLNTNESGEERAKKPTKPVKELEGGVVTDGVGAIQQTASMPTGTLLYFEPLPSETHTKCALYSCPTCNRKQSHRQPKDFVGVKDERFP
jgi:hypothetical protein